MREPRTREVRIRLTKRQYELLFQRYFADCKTAPPNFPTFSASFSEWFLQKILDATGD